METDERFWLKVDRTPTCWLWTGAADKDGYGFFQVGVGDLQRAHRWAWTAAHGAIPAGLLVCHHCDTPACVRPSHLFLGTHADNHADRNAKGRQSRRERHYNARLTQQQVDSMRDRHAAGETAAALGREFGISYSHAKNIIRGRRW